MKMSPSHHSTDAIVIGGGILGLLSARELIAEGCKVTLIEKSSPGQESSWAGGGILSPLYPWRASEAINLLSGLSQVEYPGLAEALKKSTGIDPEWIKSGLMIGECQDFDLALNWCESQGVSHQITEKSLPGLNFKPQLFLPEIAQIRNPRLLKALQLDLKQKGLNLIENQAVNHIDIQNGKVDEILTDGGRYQADRFVITAGAWSNQLFPDLALNVAPVKGQMLIYVAKPGLLSPMVLHDGHYLIPRKDGKILAGSTLEYCQFDKSTSEAARLELEGFAHQIMPALKECAVEKHWAGLRPGSTEGIPIISRHPEVENLYFNCGHFRNGFNMAPASAKMLMDIMFGRPTQISPEPYRIKG